MSERHSQIDFTATLPTLPTVPLRLFSLKICVLYTWPVSNVYNYASSLQFASVHCIHWNSLQLLASVNYNKMGTVGEQKVSAQGPKQNNKDANANNRVPRNLK